MWLKENNLFTEMSKHYILWQKFFKDKRTKFITLSFSLRVLLLYLTNFQRRPDFPIVYFRAILTKKKYLNNTQ